MWWFLAESLGERLTTPRIDVNSADRHVERLFLEGGLAALGRRIARAARASWLDSRCRSWMNAVATDWRPLDSAVALGAAGWLMTVSAATTLVVQWLGAGGPEPTTRVLPIVVAAGGLVLWWLAGRNTDGRQKS